MQPRHSLREASSGKKEEDYKELKRITIFPFIGLLGESGEAIRSVVFIAELDEAGF